MIDSNTEIVIITYFIHAIIPYTYVLYNSFQIFSCIGLRKYPNFNACNMQSNSRLAVVIKLSADSRV